MKVMKIIFVNMLVLLVMLGVLEFVLRFQTKSEIEYKPRPIEKFSHYVHHYPRSNEDGSNQRDDYAQVTNHGNCNKADRVLTILYLGDSWMANGTIANTISDDLYKDHLNQNICVVSVNAGVGSYSPSIYLVKARIMFENIQPDIVLINIDETDLMDEWIYNRDSSVRDSSGRLVAVTGLRAYTLDVLEERYKRSLNEVPSYLLRFLKREILRPFVNDFLHAAYDVEKTFESRMGPLLSNNPLVEYADEVQYFEDRLAEMIDEIVIAGISSDRVFITRHPHYLGVQPENGMRFNNVVGESISGIAGRKNIAYFDAENSFQQVHGEELEGIYLWPDDRWSHLTTKGYINYGHSIYDEFKDEFNLIISREQ